MDDLPPTTALNLAVQVALILLLVICVVMEAYIILQMQAQKRASDACFSHIAARISRIEDSGPVAFTGAMLEALRGAAFAILDGEGHPVCFGLFVTPCGVALTAAHACAYARPAGAGRAAIIRASTHLGQEFSLEVVSRSVGGLDVAVLRASGAAAAQSWRTHLPLPSVSYSGYQLLGAPVALIHGSIAWCAGAHVRQTARNNGYIVTSSSTRIQYNIDYSDSAYQGRSGAALIFRGGQVIGLHSGGGGSGLDQERSESPSARPDAVRLDVPLIWSAVQAAKAAPAAAAAGGAARRRNPRP
jgi:hypothetical protein